MIFEWLGWLALRAYPSDVRSARGEEMLGTLLDAREDSEWAFIRGCISLVIGGLRERARVNARAGSVRLLADGFIQAALLWSLWALLRWRLPPEGYSDTWPRLYLVLLIAVVVCWALGRDRIGGICGLVATGHGALEALQPGSTLGSAGVPHAAFVVQWTVIVGCFAVMALKPRVRGHDGLIWPIAALVFSFAAGIPIAVVFLLGVPLLGIVQLPVNPRLAIASAAFWTELAVTNRLGQTDLGLVTIPVLLLAIVLTVAQREFVIRRARS